MWTSVAQDNIKRDSVMSMLLRGNKMKYLVLRENRHHCGLRVIREFEYSFQVGLIFYYSFNPNNPYKCKVHYIKTR